MMIQKSCNWRCADLACRGLLLVWLLSLVIAPWPVFCASLSESVADKVGLADDDFLQAVQRQAFQYFIDCSNPANGLVMDKALNSPVGSGAVDFDYSAATIAGVGFALSAYPVGVERGWITRERALTLTRTTLKFFLEKMEHQHGFFYHFVDMQNGARAMNCEISSIDTALFIAGALFAAQYFADPEIQRLAQQLYERIDWVWMCNGGQFPSMGWTPENGFIKATWDHYSEGLLLYILALGAPEYALPAEAWNFRRLWGRYGGHVYLINQPLFTHQFPQVWLDLRGKRDAHANYFASSVQATLANRQFCLDMRPSFKTFAENRWGLSACIGPDNYQAFGAPPNPAVTDGTVAPAAAACSIVFTPQPAISALREYYDGGTLPESIKIRLHGRFGLSDSFNLDRDFVASEAFAINQGPMLLMIENYRSGLIWQHFMRLPAVKLALQQAGFRPDPANENVASETPVYETAAYMPHQRPVYECGYSSEEYAIASASFADPVWNRLSEMVIDKSLIQTIIKPPANLDFRLRWQMFHNPRSLFFRFDLHDTDLFAENSADQMYHDDCIEIYLNAGGQKFTWNGEQDYQIIMSPDAGAQNLRVREFVKGETLTGKLKWKFERLPDGYRAMIEVPKAEFGLAGSNTFAASIAAHDVNASGTVDMKYSWFFTLPEIWLAEIKLMQEKGAE